MSANVTQTKRGRKAKTVEFKKRTDEVMDNFEIRQTYILHIPIKLEVLLKNCSFNSNNENDSTFGIQSIYRDIPDSVAAYNDNSGNLRDEVVSINKPTSVETVYKPQEYSEIDKKGNSVNIKIYDNIILPVSDEPGKIKQIIAVKTNVACWWCCHTFDSYPVCAPVKYDERKELFNVVGCFCSFNCSKSYVTSEINMKSFLNSFLVKTLKGQLQYIKPAPPRTILKMFGGPLSIEEYRQTFTSLDTVKINVFPMVFFPTQIEYHKVTELTKENIERISVSKSKKGTLSRKSVDSAARRITSNTIINNSENSLVNLMKIKIRE